MKPVSVLILALLFSSSLYAGDYGYVGMCIDKYVPNSSQEWQIYRFEGQPYEDQCMYSGQEGKLMVKIPPHAKPDIYCSDGYVKFETNTTLVCLVKNSYIGFRFTGKGGGASARTSGQLHFYAPPTFNKLYFTDDVDTSLHLCSGKGNCSGQELEFHNGDHIYIVYDGNK